MSMPVGFSRRVRIFLLDTLNSRSLQFSSEWAPNVEKIAHFVEGNFLRSHVYFKSEQMHDMDHHIGDLYSFIVGKYVELCIVLYSLLTSFL